MEEFDSYALHLGGFKNWCEEHFLNVTEVSSNVFECAGKKFLFLSEKDGCIFDENFAFVLNSQEEELLDSVDAVVYKFGTRFCYTDKSSMDKPDEGNIKDFLYLGKTTLTVPGNPFLGIHGLYELLNGSRPYSDWIAKAKFLGINVLGLCEKNTLAGTMPFQLECEKNGIKSILGETITIDIGKDLFVEGKVYSLTEQGWKNLLLINSEINVKNPSQYITIDRLLELGWGNVFVFDPLSFAYDEKLVRKFQKSFDLVYYKLDSVKYENDNTDKTFLNNTQSYLNNSIGLKPILLCDAYYLEKEDCDVKIDLNRIAGVKNNLSRNQYFKADDENLLLFDGLFKNTDFENVVLTAIDSLLFVAEESSYKIPTGKFKLPEYLLTSQEKAEFGDSETMFESLIAEGWEELEIDKKPNVEEYLLRLQEEISVIKEGHFIDYFLVLWDIISWSRRNGILVGLGRGSAAGSIISFLLGITQVDPLEYGLLFERFMNRGRLKQSLPDVDTDVESERRDDVKSYMESRYGKDRVCSLGTYTTLQLKAALKDFSRTRNIPLATVEFMSKILSVRDNEVMKAPWEHLFKVSSKSEPFHKFIQDHSEMVEEMKLIQAAPRSASVHACACLILPKDETLYTSVPVRKTEMDGKEMIVSEWEGPYIEGAGYLKEDILGILQLDKFRMMLDLIKEHYDRILDIYNLPLNDSGVYDMFSKGLNGDVFQLGSKGLTTYCMQVKPTSLKELCAVVALYRPGPMDNGFHLDYVKVKNGAKSIEYFPGLEDITKETFGLLVYQEQIMLATTHIAGFTLQEADDVRKGMGKKKMKYLEEKGVQFVEGGVRNGYDRKYLESLWKKMMNFGKYAFNKCVDGRTILYRPSSPKGRYLPTIEEMYRIKNDCEYAIHTGHLALHRKYNRLGYGFCWSLNEENKLVKNKIKDIYYQGERETYTVTLESGKQITCTDNHKFPTENGKVQLKDLNVGDSLFVSSGFQKMGESGLPTHFEKIVSIEFAGVRSVYDVEMEHPYHTFAIDNGIVTSNSHSLCYAETGYICGYIKYHYPLPYWITALQFANDENLPRFISEINRSQDISLVSPDINKSGRKFYADFNTKRIVWSIARVKQCGDVAVNAILSERDNGGEFFDLNEFLFRVDKSKVNKSVVENLILAGAFDEMCDVHRPSDRQRVIEQYREIMKCKIDKKKDFLSLAIESGQTENEWWWLLQQKKVSGLAFFDYPTLIAENDYDFQKYLPLDEFEVEDMSRIGTKMALTAGIVEEVEFKTSKNGDYAKFRIEQNYSYVWVTVWNDDIEKWRNVLENSEGKIAIVRARAYYDTFKGENALQSDPGFEMKIIS